MSDRREAIKQAYVETIRNVLILDDRYPDYAKLGEGSEPAYDIASAVRLWQGFRVASRACNISSARKDVSDSYLEHTDLLILDYELDADDQGHKGSTARQTLRTLAGNTRQNMVIVYTARPDLLEVKLEISVGLTGLPICGDLDETEQERFDEWLEDQPKDIDYNTLLSYIYQTDKWREGAGPAIRFAEERIRRRLRNYVLRDVGDKKISGRFQVSDTEPHWLRVGSVFISLLQKQVDHTANDLLNHLTDSLEKWKPSFMRLMLAYARAGIVEQGISGDDRVLRDPETEAAWMFYTDESVDFDERRERVGVLYARLVDDLLEHSLDRLLNFSAQHGGEDLSTSKDPLTHAMERAGVLHENMAPARLALAERRVIHKINHYLAFERGPSGRLRSGAVFKDQDNDKYGIITTPDCDLVVGQSKKTGDDTMLGTAMRVVYRPAFIVPDAPKQQRAAFERATDFNHIFLHVPSEEVADGYLVLALYVEGGKTSDHPPTRVLYVANRGRLDQGYFTAQRVTMNDSGGTLELSAAHSFQVVAQLRDRYALRLLHEAGHHLSRTGVDFVRRKLK